MKNSTKQSRIGLVLIGISLAFVVVLTSMINTRRVDAQVDACSDLSSDLGLLTRDIQLSSAGNYDVWARVKSPDGASEFAYSIDGDGGSLCDQTMSGSGGNDTWIWVKGSSQLNWSGGPAHIQISGTKAGVGLDCIVLTQDGGFSPTGVEGCEAPPDETAPSVNITSPTSGSNVNLVTEITANAVDNVEVENVTFYVNGNQIGSPDTTSPYSVELNTLTLADGSYTLTAVAEDTSGNTTTSSGVDITVENNPYPPSASDLRSRWEFDDGSGVTADDSVGSNDGTLAGGATWGTGNDGGAVELNGSTGRVELDSMNFNATALTVSGWINPSSYTSDARIISKATGTSDQDHTLMISMLNSGGAGNVLRFRLKTGGNTTTLVADSGTVPLNSWSHFAATYDGSDMKLYLNGIEVGSTPKTGNVDSNTANTWIGANPNGSSYFNGRVDDVQVYDTAIDALQVAALANGTEPEEDGEPDTTNPAVSIDSPSNNQTVSGTINITSTATDNVAVQRVSYYLDDSSTAFSNDSSAPYETSWNSASVSNGTHTIKAIATDTSGNTAETTVTIDVQNTTPDTEAPTVSITSPSNNATVDGWLNIDVDASDNVGVSKVELVIDGVTTTSEDTIAPFRFTIDTTELSDSVHEIRARAYDAEGQNTLSDIVTITVNNIPDPIPVCEDEDAINYGDPLPCEFEEDPPTKPGDINNDGKVDRDDLRIVLFYYLRNVPANTDGDLDGNGYVQRDDLRVVLFYYEF